MTEISRATRAAALAQFVARFDAGDYWLAHEVLEELWMDERVDGYKGLIHLAAASLHLERGNKRGAVSKLRSGLQYLAPPARQLAGFDLASISAHFATLLEDLEAGDDPATSVARRPAFSSFLLGTHYRGAVMAELDDEALPYRVRRHAQGYRTGRDPRRRD